MRRAGLGHRRIMDANAAGSFCEPDGVSFGQYVLRDTPSPSAANARRESTTTWHYATGALQRSSPPFPQPVNLDSDSFLKIPHISWKLIPPVSAPLYYCPA